VSDTGRSVLAGKADHITLSGSDAGSARIYWDIGCVGEGTSATGRSFLNANSLRIEFFPNLPENKRPVAKVIAWRTVKK
jgi:hypothetical protein